MICIKPECTNGKVRCIETRASRSSTDTTRKYKCQLCETAFYTEEKLSAKLSKVVQTEQQRADAFARLSVNRVISK